MTAAQLIEKELGIDFKRFNEVEFAFLRNRKAYHAFCYADCDPFEVGALDNLNAKLLAAGLPCLSDMEVDYLREKIRDTH